MSVSSEMDARISSRSEVAVFTFGLLIERELINDYLDFTFGFVFQNLRDLYHTSVFIFFLREVNICTKS